MTADVAVLDQKVRAIDPRLTVELTAGVYVLHGPKAIPVGAEVAALRVLEPVCPRFVFHPDDV